MKILLDTTAYVEFKRNAAEVVEIIVRAELILFSPIVLGELMFGFRNGTRFKENMDLRNMSSLKDTLIRYLSRQGLIILIIAYFVLMVVLLLNRITNGMEHLGRLLTRMIRWMGL